MKYALFLIISGFITLEANAAAYQLITPASSQQFMPCWAQHYPQYNQVVGYSALGHVFLRANQSKQYIVLHPYKGAAKSYGEHASVTEFEQAVLKDAGFAEFVLKPQRVNAITQRIGPLLNEEIYIPKPYPFMGGDESITSYHKGDLWVMLQLTAQLQRLCD